MASMERRTSVTTTGQVEVVDQHDEAWFDWKAFWTYSGPGVLMSIAYLDPGNLEADLQQGAYTGLSLAWVLLLAHAIGLLLQVLAAKVGNVTGKNLAQLCSTELPPRASLILYVIVEIAIIGADIQEIVGSAIAFNILFGVPMWAGCMVTVLDTFVLLFIDHYGIRTLEAVFMVLLGTMSICFFANFLQDPPSVGEMAAGFLPYMPAYGMMHAIGTLGSVIMPHNIYLHSALVLSRDVDRSNPSQVRTANKYCAIDSTLALALCFLVNLAVVGCFAQNFYSSECAVRGPDVACVSAGIVLPGSLDDGHCVLAHQDSATQPLGECAAIGLRRAGDALQTSLGNIGRIIWALGLLAAGQSSTLTTTYAGQFVMEGLIKIEIPGWARVAVTRLIALVPALIVALFPLSTGQLRFDSLDQWLNVLQSVALPFAVVPVLLFTDSKKIMGDFCNTYTLSITCWVCVVSVMLMNMYMLVYQVRDVEFAPSETIIAVVCMVCAIYTFGISWLISFKFTDYKGIREELPSYGSTPRNDL